VKFRVSERATYFSKCSFADLIGALTVFTTQAVICFANFKRLMPTSAGWYLTWAEEASRRIVYKDFFFPFPPGALFFEGVIPTKFSQSFAMQETWNIFTWLGLSLAIYALARLFSSVPISIVASTIGLVSYICTPGKIIAGYYETMLAFLIIGLVSIIYGFRLERSRLILVGIFAVSMSTLVKQTAWGPAFFILMFTSIYLWRQESQQKLFRLFLLFATAPWLVVTAWNLRVGNFISMWSALLSGGGKGSNKFGFVTTFLGGLTPVTPRWPFLVLFVSLILTLILDLRSNFRRISLSALISYCFLSLLMDENFSLSGTSRVQNFFFWIGLLTIGYCILRWLKQLQSIPLAQNQSLIVDHWDIWLVSFLVLLMLICGFLVQPAKDTQDVFSLDFQLWFRQAGEHLMTSMSGFFILSILLLILLYNARDFLIRPPTLLSRLTRLDILILLAFIVMQQLMNAFAGSPSVEMYLVSIVICLSVIGETLRTLIDRHGLLLFVSLSMPWVAFMVPIKLENPYSWMGNSEASLSAQRVTLDVGRAVDFQVETVRARVLQTIDTELKRSETFVQDKRVFFAIRNAGMAALFDVEPYPLKCVVLWWDVCPEPLAKMDRMNLAKNPPSRIVWTNESEPIYKANESVWLKGKVSSVSQIKLWIEEEVARGRYIKALDITYEPGNESARTVIYLRNFSEDSKLIQR